MTPPDKTGDLPLDRQVDAWLASLRNQGYSARQLEYRAGVLGRWATGDCSSSRSVARIVASFNAWRHGE